LKRTHVRGMLMTCIEYIEYIGLLTFHIRGNA
jgi:hypothetical protein